ncbi:hypothetical protein A3C59_01585 [Candidatus Daviesbacteria bacterium RIFCSPHIGHO2_02_FULL_36_13]|uniref:Glycosyl transferase family 28 C-terminal domain-containing protein n=1 Tax=Candidatus Daviesbacteria bacterium RIFCSPHIGHO2_02_FULL_36_13 TaxID=1797768 RepID=A0A1F5JV67_9BACT|nr:MAG: hypothetical protein A3C59_01585 [Candidatus Daviesbacteria bacterium RIFCSPHIGHO2_02_FULL_36_13]
MKILVCYSETGGGHLRAAQALAEELSLRKNIEVVLIDVGKETNWGQKINPSLTYYFISHYLLPLYNLIYRLTDNQFGVRILRFTIKLFWGKAFKKILNREKPDLILTTHPIISPSTVNLDNKIPFVVVVLDLGKPHRIWFDKWADYIIVPDKEMASWASKKFKIEPSKLKPLGYPLRAAFKNPDTSTSSNTILILGAGIESLLVISWIKKIKKKFPDKKIVVVCGHNILLEKILSKLKYVKSFGFIDNLDNLLNEADLVITKAGPGIIMEAAALKKTIIVTRWVVLQEKGNVNFVLENRLGLYDPKGKNLVSSIEKIYKNYQKYTSPKNIISFDTEVMADYIINLIK